MRRVALPLISVLLVGCGGEETENAGGSTVGTWELSAEPDVLIGGMDPRPDYQLDRVMDATRLSDGRVVIANGGSSELLVYDSSGTFVQAMGGPGEGPGEFQGLMQLNRLDGDSLMVLSFRPGLTWYAPDGGFVDSKRIDFWGAISAECRLGESNWYGLPDGSFLTVLLDNFGISGCPPSPEEPWRQSALIARSTLEGPGYDTLAILPATERNSPNYRAYGRDLVIDFAEDRVYAADTGAEVILVLSFEGDTLARLPTPFESRPVPPEARTQDLRRWTDREGNERVGQAYLYPDTYPRIARILAGPGNQLWVMRYPELVEPVSSWRLFRSFSFVVEPDGGHWKVLDEGGEVVAEVRTPAGFFPLEVGDDYLLGLTRDELDVQSVVVYSLTK